MELKKRGMSEAAAWSQAERFHERDRSLRKKYIDLKERVEKQQRKGKAEGLERLREVMSEAYSEWSKARDESIEADKVFIDAGKRANKKARK